MPDGVRPAPVVSGWRVSAAALWQTSGNSSVAGWRSLALPYLGEAGRSLQPPPRTRRRLARPRARRGPPRGCPDASSPAARNRRIFRFTARGRRRAALLRRTTEQHPAEHRDLPAQFFDPCPQLLGGGLRTLRTNLRVFGTSPPIRHIGVFDRRRRGHNTQHTPSPDRHITRLTGMSRQHLVNLPAERGSTDTRSPACPGNIPQVHRTLTFN